jgi:phosphopantetheinyl transferase
VGDATCLVEVVRVADVLAGIPDSPHLGAARLSLSPRGGERDWLSESEAERVATLRHAGRRAQYLAGHWLARVLLARAFGGVPMQWRLRERKGQPPEVQGRGDALRVSISHAGEWLAVAVADAPVGIDIEVNTRVLDDAVEPLLREPGEAPGSLDAGTRLRRWVAKEAWIKRDHGSALPARLQALRLWPGADVRLWRHAELHLALAVAVADPGMPASLEVAGGFQVRESLS